MKPWIRWILATIFLAAAIHLLAVWSFPSVIMTLAGRVISKKAQGVNVIYHSPPVDVQNNEVVMQSPDLLYSSFVFDLAQTPVRITAPVPDTYWSLSLYDMTTTNFYVLNDRMASGQSVDVLLVDKNTTPPASETARIVVSPTTRGVGLLRTLVPDGDRLPALIKMQKAAVCTSGK